MEANNMAAMREALELFAHMNDDGFYDKSPVVRSIVNKARAALAKPPRNCDAYQNKKDAEVAFLSEECSHPCGNCTVSDEYGCALVHECGVEWLFAPAKGKEGETDGSK